MTYGPGYFFLEAYDRLGRHLYPNTWDGREIIQDALPSPESVMEERAPLERRIEKIQTEVLRTQKKIGSTVKEDEIADLTETERTLIDNRQKVHAELRNLYEVDDNFRRRYAAFDRAETAKSRLIGALQAGHLKATLGQSLEAPRHLWNGQRGFAYYLELSIAVLPRTFSAKRREPVIFRRKDFDNWLADVVPFEFNEVHPPTPEVLCRAFLRRTVEESTRIEKKLDCWLRAEAEIPKLSERKFDRLWDEIVPHAWKRPGRRRAQ